MADSQLSRCVKGELKTRWSRKHWKLSELISSLQKRGAEERLYTQAGDLRWVLTTSVRHWLNSSTKFMRELWKDMIGMGNSCCISWVIHIQQRLDGQRYIHVWRSAPLIPTFWQEHVDLRGFLVASRCLIRKVPHYQAAQWRIKIWAHLVWMLRNFLRCHWRDCGQ